MRLYATADDLASVEAPGSTSRSVIPGDHRLHGTAPLGDQEYRAVRVCQTLVPFGFLLPADHNVPEPVVRPSKLSTLFPPLPGAG